MKFQHANFNSGPGIAALALLVTCATARPADKPTLKDAYEGHFHIGVAINRSVATGTAVRADNVNRALEAAHADTAVVLTQFNQIAPENDLKWALIHPKKGADGYHFGPADAFVNFGVSNNMYITGHTLVWHSQTPDWVFAGTNPPPEAANAPAGAPGRRSGYSGLRASREELLERMREHIHTVVGRYQGRIKVWDVVNEALADGGTNVLCDSLWVEIIGPDFIAKAFEYAHEADPDAILRYNDYSLESPAKRAKLITLIKSLQAQNVPVHAIGSQTHVNAGTSFETMAAALTEMATLGLPVHITELDVNIAVGGQRGTGAEVGSNAAATEGGLVDHASQRQAEAYADLFRAFLKHQKSVKMVTFWGVNDGVSWRSNGKPLLFDRNNQPKPAFDAVIRVAASEKPGRR